MTDIQACADIVQTRDPARFRGAMAAPPEMRGGLMVIYALNAELVQAAWAPQEPALAEIRLQYWHEQLEAVFGGKATDAHPALRAMARADWRQWLAKADLLRLIEARRRDVLRAPFADAQALWAYLDATGGAMMAMGARILRMDDHYDPDIRRYGRAGALAAYLVAVPALKASGRQPLPDKRPAAIVALAREALADLDAPRRHRLMARAGPAMLTASEARPVLRQVLRQPALVLTGGLERSAFRKQMRALACELFHLW